MAKLLICWFLVIISNSSLAIIIPTSPCPEIFNYERDPSRPLLGPILGIMTIDGVRSNFNNNVRVDLSIPSLRSKSVGSIRLLNMNDLPQQPARFEVYFPPGISLPSVVLITFNGRVICQGTTPIKGPWTNTMSLSYHVFVPTRKLPNRFDGFQNAYTTRTTRVPFKLGIYQVHEEPQQTIPNEVIRDRRTTRRPESNDVACGQSAAPALPLIMGGVKTRHADWPWLSVLFYKNRDLGSVEFRCGASLISDRVLLTAAHCLLKSDGTSHLQPRDILVSLGRHNIMEWDEPTSKTLTPRSLIIHPDYSSETLDYDIAIVTLSESITYTAHIRPVCLWNEPDDESLLTGQTGTVVGWGYSTMGALSEVPKQVQLNIVSEVDCIRSDLGLQLTTSKRTFCAGGDGSGPCQGDSGSGLYLRRGSGKGHWVLRGIVSHSLLDPDTGKCDTRKYSVYTDVAKFRDWLRENSVGGDDAAREGVGEDVSEVVEESAQEEDIQDNIGEVVEDEVEYDAVEEDVGGWRWSN